MAGEQQIRQLFRKHLKECHGIDIDQDRKITEKEIERHLKQEEVLIPVTIFSERLSPAETIVKFLRENEGLSNSKTASLLGRTPAGVWITYRNARQKIEQELDADKTDIYLPTGIFTSRLSILESIARYLHEEHDLNYSDIGRMLKRNERTIWTVCKRAEKKLGVET